MPKIAHFAIHCQDLYNPTTQKQQLHHFRVLWKKPQRRTHGLQLSTRKSTNLFWTNASRNECTSNSKFHSSWSQVLKYTHLQRKHQNCWFWTCQTHRGLNGGSKPPMWDALHDGAINLFFERLHRPIYCEVWYLVFWSYSSRDALSEASIRIQQQRL